MSRTNQDLHIDTCPVCTRPAHASESDDYGRCTDCIVTDGQIQALRDEAGAAWDPAMVETCHLALDGDPGARAECASVIRYAREAKS